MRKTETAKTASDVMKAFEDYCRERAKSELRSDEGIPELSESDINVLQRLFNGRTHQEIASELKISRVTVQNFRNELYHELQSTLSAWTKPNIKIKVDEADSVTPTTRPPINAEYLLYLLLPKADQDCEIGDLVERYASVAQRFSKRRADFWYYKQVIGFCFSWLRRIVLKLGGLIWLGRFLQRLIS